MAKMPTESERYLTWLKNQQGTEIYLKANCRDCGGCGVNTADFWKKSDVLLATMQKEFKDADEWQAWLETDEGKVWVTKWLAHPASEEYRKENPCPACKGSGKTTVHLSLDDFVALLADPLARKGYRQMTSR